MWLSESGQTAAIRSETRTASVHQVIALARTGGNNRESPAPSSTKGETHQTSNGRSSRMIAVRLRTMSRARVSRAGPGRSRDDAWVSGIGMSAGTFIVPSRCR